MIRESCVILNDVEKNPKEILLQETGASGDSVQE